MRAVASGGLGRRLSAPRLAGELDAPRQPRAHAERKPRHRLHGPGSPPRAAADDGLVAAGRGPPLGLSARPGPRPAGWAHPRAPSRRRAPPMTASPRPGRPRDGPPPSRSDGPHLRGIRGGWKPFGPRRTRTAAGTPRGGGASGGLRVTRTSERHGFSSAPVRQESSAGRCGSAPAHSRRRRGSDGVPGRRTGRDGSRAIGFWRPEVGSTGGGDRGRRRRRVRRAGWGVKQPVGGQG